jgi:hypothetical protein
MPTKAEKSLVRFQENAVKMREHIDRHQRLCLPLVPPPYIPRAEFAKQHAEYTISAPWAVA